MKMPILLSCALLLVTCIYFIQPVIFAADNETITLDWQTLDQGIELAKQQNKPVLIDFYTDWCGWCKKMDRDTYGNENVAKFLRENFIVVKLNPDHPVSYKFQGQYFSARQIAGMFGVSGYPATGFLNSKGEAITLLSGYIPAESFLPILSYIEGRWYEKMSFDKYQQQQQEYQQQQSNS